jgi:AraC-like DNA-binding protein
MAKHLIRYTDKSLVDISIYLYFSSQSYFQNLFKKKYGITPNRFRQKMWESKEDASRRPLA